MKYEVLKYYMPGWEAAAGAVIDTGLNWLMQGQVNKGSHDLTTQMYAQQRKDSLADWNMQNAYNSPSAQMARYKAAGLNPNLIYGQSNVAAPVRSSSPGSWSPSAPAPSEVGKGLVAQYQVNRMQAETDNIKAQNLNIQKQSALLDAQTEAVKAGIGKTTQDTLLSRVNTAIGEFGLGKAQSILPYDVKAAELGVKQQEANIQYTLDNNQRQTMLANQTVKEGIQHLIQQALDQAKTVQETKNLQIVYDNLIKQGKIASFENRLNEKGLTKGDSMWWRAIATFWDEIMKAVNGE